MSETRKILKTSGLLGALTLLSRFTGLARDVVIAALLGGSRAADVFFIAFQLPNLLRRVLGEGALSSFVVPLFAGRRKEAGEAEGWVFINRALNWLFLITLLLVIAGMIFSSEVFHAFGGLGMAAEGRAAGGIANEEAQAAIAQGVSLTRLMFPYMIGLALASIMMGACHALKSFTAPAFGSIVLNFAMIGAGAAALFGSVETYQALRWLGWAVLAGAVVRILIMIPVLARAGWRWRAEFSARDPEVNRLFRMMGAGLFGLSIAQINISVALLLATFLGEGKVTYLTYANRLIQFPMALTATAMATAMLPSLTDLILENKADRLREVIGFTKRIEVVFMIPAMLGLMFFGLPIVELIFEHGAFDAEDSAGTYGALIFYAPGLLPLGWSRLLLPIFYARKDVKTPVKAAAVTMVVNIALGLAFTFGTPLGHRGLALAATLAGFVNYALLSWFLKNDPARPLEGLDIGQTVGRALAAGLVGIGGLSTLFHLLTANMPADSTTIGRAIVLLPFLLASVPLYFFLAHRFAVPDSDRAYELVKRRLSRKRPDVE